MRVDRALRRSDTVGHDALAHTADGNGPLAAQSGSLPAGVLR